jgi:hypothetical protein
VTLNEGEACPPSRCSLLAGYFAFCSQLINLRLCGSKFLFQKNGAEKTGWLTLKSANVARLPEKFRLVFKVIGVEGLPAEYDGGDVKVKVRGHSDITSGLTLENVGGEGYEVREHYVDMDDYRVNIEVSCKVSLASNSLLLPSVARHTVVNRFVRCPVNR